jgi:glycosyltransferase involved in cell wall biosynthesis
VIGGLRKIEGFLYRRAARIVAVARSTPRILAERGFDPGKMEVVPNGVDLDFFRPGPRDNEVRRKYAPDGGFLLSYVGTHGMAHALDTMLDAAVMLRDRSDIRFMLVGEGAEKERLVARSRELGLPTVVFVEQQPRAMLPAFYQASDACLVPLRKTPLFQAVLPSKMFEIMGMARPILLSVEGEAKDLLEEAEAGIAIPPESAEALRDALLRLANDPGLCARMGEKGRRYVETSYSRAALAEKYAAILEDVSRERKPRRS